MWECAVGFGANIIIPAGISGVWRRTSLDQQDDQLDSIETAWLTIRHPVVCQRQSVRDRNRDHGNGRFPWASSVHYASLNVGTGLLSSGGNLTLDRFVSSLTALPSAGATASFAHGLGAVPFAIYLLLQNVTADLGYSARRSSCVAARHGKSSDESTTASRPIAMRRTCISWLSSSGRDRYLQQEHGLIAAITNANWKLDRQGVVVSSPILIRSAATLSQSIADTAP